MDALFLLRIFKKVNIFRVFYLRNKVKEAVHHALDASSLFSLIVNKKILKPFLFFIKPAIVYELEISRFNNYATKAAIEFGC